MADGGFTQLNKKLLRGHGASCAEPVFTGGIIVFPEVSGVLFKSINEDWHRPAEFKLRTHFSHLTGKIEKLAW